MTNQDEFYLTQLKDYIRIHSHINRIIISGTGKGAATAAIFTLRHIDEMTSWPALMPSPSKFRSTTPPIHDIYDIHEGESRDSPTLLVEQNTFSCSQQLQQIEEQKIDVKCVTFGCPGFIQKSDISLIPTSSSSRIIHVYGEHETIPLSLTSLTNTFERVGLVVHIKDSRSSNIRATGERAS